MTVSELARTAAQIPREGRPGRSRVARSIALDLLAVPILARRRFMATLTDERDRHHVIAEVEKETGSLYGLWHDAPAAFVEDVLGETIWSKQREILEAIPVQKRTAVPAGFGVGKTWIGGRATAWFVCVHPVGTALVVTTATRFRQVRNQLWPHIRRSQARAVLPGNCLQTEWWMPDQYGVDTQVAYGFTVPEHDEAAMQGIHAAKLLLIVDEAGGIARTIGAGTNNLLTGDARMLAIGNPPTDDPNSWFESLSDEGHDAEEPGTVTISIAAIDSPAITGEITPWCKDCPSGVPKHRIGDPVAGHLPNQEWVDRTIREYGEDHPYVQAKVYAKFPRGAANRIIPTSWVESSLEIEEPEGPDYVRLCDLGLETEADEYMVKRGAWVRLGVDVAADGGDEFTIYRSIGNMVHKRFARAGADNANAVDVAEVILQEILAAQALAAALGTKQRIRVKIDGIGVGWGVASSLQRWAETKRHQADIVVVLVSESPESVDESALMIPRRKRDEMWIAMRQLLQPDPSSGFQHLRLRVDRKCAAQLSGPKSSSPTGLTVVESKASMKARGVPSPDRAEAAMLAVYEPFPLTRRRGLIV